LGDDAKFKWDPVKKKYVFPDDNGEEEEDIPPPPISTTKSD
jgi:hypothetical protein